MDFEIGMVLTLADDLDYVISQGINDNGNTYMLLVQIPEYKSFKYVKVLNENELEEIEDFEEIERLSKLFTNGKA